MSNLTQNSVDLEWKPPAKDGGTPVTDYIIEYRTTNRTTWSVAKVVSSKVTNYTATSLTENAEYFFRIIAVNAEGNSRPLMSSDVVKPQRDLSKYFIIMIILILCLELKKKSSSSSKLKKLIQQFLKKFYC